MKLTSTVGLFVLAGIATAQVPISAFDFADQTTNPFINCAQPWVKPLENRQDGNPTNPGGDISFVTETVGTVSKQVALVPTNNLLRAGHGLPGNGGGAYTNLYTIVMDVKFTDAVVGGWASIFNTNDDNENDGDSFVRWDGENEGTAFGAIGISGNYGGNINEDQWYRLAVSVECGYNFGSGTRLKYYLDGTLVHTVETGSGTDGRWALYCKDDGEDVDHVDILADDNGEDTDARLSALAFYDSVLTDAEVLALGGPGSSLPMPNKVLGVVTLSDFEGANELQNVAMELRSGASVLDSQGVVLGADGSYLIQTRSNGTVSLSAKGTHWLKKSSAEFSLSTTGEQIGFVLMNGDADGDNEVNLVDFGRVSAAFGSIEGDTNWDPNADLNGDGEVNLVDFGILSATFGNSGDE